MTQISAIKVSKKEISNYGVLKFGKNKRSVVGLIEKPNVKDAPSLYASIGRYVVSPKIFNLLKTISPGRSNELQLADALNILAEKGEVKRKSLVERDSIVGQLEGYLDAIRYLASTE